jgi:ribosome biogenesis protein Tsr3
MIKSETIIIPSHLPWDYHCDYLKQTALTLAKKNKVIVFYPFEGVSLFKLLLDPKKRASLSKQSKNIIHLRPIYPLPFQRLKFIQKANHWLSIWQLKLFLSLQKTKKPILWIFSPELAAFLGKLNEKLSLYDCVDDYSGYDPKKTRSMKDLEKTILKKADLVFTNSPALYRVKKDQHPQAFQVPQGAKATLFLKTKKKAIPKDLRNIPAPRIGFFGNNDCRLDLDLIETVAKKNQKFSFVFLGPISFSNKNSRDRKLAKKLRIIKKLNNIYFLGKKPTKADLIPYLDHFDIAWIPYNINYEFVRYSYPMKVFEYFARGKVVISTPIESLIPLSPLVQIIKNTQEFSQKAKRVLKDGWPKEYIKKQKQATLDNSWQAKLEKISQIIEQELRRKLNF